jgi:hypothetical protein
VVVYDEEFYRNVFLLCAGDVKTRKSLTFEISDRRDDREEMFKYMRKLYADKTWMVGYNSLQLDWPLLSYILNHKKATNEDIFKYGEKLIKAENPPYVKHIIPQIDLFKVHHFDNVARMTSLKVLEFNMRMDNIEDLPFPPGSVLSHDQIDELRRYVKHDVKATADFLKASEPQLAFRRDLSKKYGRNFMNFNDVRIGKEIFIDALEKAGVRIRDDNGNLRQTPREQIVVKDILLPYLSFNHPELRRVHEEFKNLIIVNTKGDLKISADLDGFQLDYGTGGLHGSVTDTLVESDDEWVIIDCDVTSMYPSISIMNNIYPEHMGEKFCSVYRNLFEERKKHKKGTAENGAYKLALNGTFGASNSEFSPFYDPQFTMAITIGGELSLSMLCEGLAAIGEDVKLLSVNTDGITCKVARKTLDKYHQVCKDWENVTGLTLEYAEYKKMYITDVNNYIAEYAE